MSKFIVVGNKAIRADSVTIAERNGPERCNVLVGDTWIELVIPLPELLKLLESRLEP